jgi:hypothetical protein
MKKLEMNQMSDVQGGKFWGWGDEVTDLSCGVNTAGQCACSYTETYYAFGIAVATRRNTSSADPSNCPGGGGNNV